MAISIQELSVLSEGDIVLFKIGDEYYPIEIKYIVDKSISKYIVGTDGVAYMLNEIFMEGALTE